MSRRARGCARAIVVLGVLAGAVAFCGAALAYFSSTGSGTGTATSAVLGAPSGVAGTQTAGTNTVVVSWTAPTGSPAPTGYYVLRTSTAGGGAQPACATSAASPTAGTSCSDTGVAADTYTYSVVAVFRTWTKTSSPSSSVTVLPANQTITYTSTAPSSALAGGPQYTPTATASSGLPVTFTIDAGTCTISGGKVSFPHAGTCIVDADQAGNANYLAAPRVQQTFSVAKGTQTLTFTSAAPSAAVVSGATYLASASTSGSSGNPVTFSSATSAVCTTGGTNGSTVSFVGTGSCTINADQAGGSDWNAGVTAQQTFAVGKGSQTVSFTGNPGATAAAGRTGTATATGGASGNPVIFSSATSSVCTVSGATVTYVTAGTCTINGDQASSTNYNAAPTATQTYTVAPVLQTLSDITLANGGSSGYFDTGDTLTLSFSQKMNPTSICSTWTPTTGTQSIPVAVNLNVRTVTVTTGSCTLTYGSFDLGATYGSPDGFAFNGTVSITNNPTSATVTLTVGNRTFSGSGLTYQGSGSVPSFTPAAGVRDNAGDQLPTSAYTASHASTM